MRFARFRWLAWSAALATPVLACGDDDSSTGFSGSATVGDVSTGGGTASTGGGTDRGIYSIVCDVPDWYGGSNANYTSSIRSYYWAEG